MGNRPSSKKATAKQQEEPSEDLFAWEKDADVPQRLDFDVWYPLVAPHTMNSILLECTQEEVAAITEACDENRPGVLRSGGSKLTDTHKQSLAGLAAKIDKFIADNNYSDTGIFVRFSKRSPKDSILRINKDKFKQNVQTYARSAYTKPDVDEQDKKQTNDDAQIINAIILAMTVESCAGLCVKSGEEALALITHSDRIFQDFKLGALVMGEDKFRPKLILREFNHAIQFEYEFRVFVFKNKMTAITQYNSMVCLQRLVENKQQFESGIRRFWEQNIVAVMEENGISSYVMDVALVQKAKDKKDNEDEENDDEKKEDNEEERGLEFVLIEMNPFCTQAGALLFDWKEDVKLMTSEPCTFRILEAPYNERPKKLTAELNVLFDELYNELK